MQSLHLMPELMQSVPGTLLATAASASRIELSANGPDICNSCSAHSEWSEFAKVLLWAQEESTFRLRLSDKTLMDPSPNIHPILVGFTVKTRT